MIDDTMIQDIVSHYIDLVCPESRERLILYIRIKVDMLKVKLVRQLRHVIQIMR